MAPLLIGYALTLVLFLGLPWSRRTKRVLETNQTHTHRTSSVLAIVHVTGLILPLVFVLDRSAPKAPIQISWAADATMIGALLLQQRAQNALGNYFTISLQAGAGQAICRSGPYRWVRHPAYLAQIVFWTSLALSSRSIDCGIIVGLLALTGYAYRIRVEERMLESVIGRRYRAEAARKRLLPLVW